MALQGLCPVLGDGYLLQSDGLQTVDDERTTDGRVVHHQGFELIFERHLQLSFQALADLAETISAPILFSGTCFSTAPISNATLGMPYTTQVDSF